MTEFINQKIQKTTEESEKDLVEWFYGDVETESKELRMVKRVFKKQIRKLWKSAVTGQWKVKYDERGKKKTHSFKEKPTEDYLRRLQERSKSEHLQKCLDRLKEHAAKIKAGALPQAARLGVLQPEPKCKHCGGNEWVMNQRFACAKCGMEGRAIHPTGFDHRNMPREDGHDPSQNNGFVHDHDLSDAANRATIVHRAPPNARKSGAPMATRPFQAIQLANRRLNPRSRADNQIISTEHAMEDFCSTNQLPPIIAKKAHAMFKTFVKDNDHLPREDETIAACLLNCLPRVELSSAGASSAGAGASSAGAGASSVGGSSAGASAGASSAGGSASASRKRPRFRCLSPEDILLVRSFYDEETKKKKRRNSL